jgi:ClpP class serine protease
MCCVPKLSGRSRLRESVIDKFIHLRKPPHGRLASNLRYWRLTKAKMLAAMNISPMDLFWIFIMMTSLQPVMKQRRLEATRLIAQIERKRGSRVILLAHRQETMSVPGFPLMRYIDVNDSAEVIRAIRLTDPNVPIDLVLHTTGGLVLAATQIASAISRRKGKVAALVPHCAMSGGTPIALAADEIIISDHAVLGPDPQIGQYPAASLRKAVEQKSKDRPDEWRV